MPAVKRVQVKDDDGNVIDDHIEPSSTFVASVAKNRQPMIRPDGRGVNVNRKLQSRGHYDDKHGFTFPPKDTGAVEVKKGAAK